MAEPTMSEMMQFLREQAAQTAANFAQVNATISGQHADSEKINQKVDQVAERVEEDKREVESKIEKVGRDLKSQLSQLETSLESKIEHWSLEPCPHYKLNPQFLHTR